jgi:hypothetical protein
MVELNFGHSRPPTMVNLGELAELRGWKRRRTAGCGWAPD